ncbi:hypothetical protein AVEN_249746-1 [Araneus ventricosus]|uniref:Reverse transcriptase domain-containing protein n=1 Tax=Araneus ventricosus TaxID=182803 RepID=A0A4Y2C6N2_ARAVE|nr:hypothetical protein AVEN_249746-1 [Araneus ventricosus]
MRTTLFTLMVSCSNACSWTSREIPQISFINFSKTELLKYGGGTLCPAPKNAQKGIPQGNVLSPIHFFCNMPNFFEILDDRVECSIFADDIFICSLNSLDYAIRKLQNTLWKLTIRPEKSFIAELSKRKLYVQPRVTYAEFPLAWKDSIKYLGICFSKTNQNGIILKIFVPKLFAKSTP